MEGSALASRAVQLTATVRVRGPDPDGAIASRAVFATDAGDATTALSSSGTRVAPGYFVAPLALFAPFLAPDPSSLAPPALALAPGVEVHVLRGRDRGRWLPAVVARVAIPPEASAAAASLAGPDGLGALHRDGWFAAAAAGPAPSPDLVRDREPAANHRAGTATPGRPPRLSAAAAVAGAALLRVPGDEDDPKKPPPPRPSPGTGTPIPARLASRDPVPGDAILACGSPFGVLAPAHFAACVARGAVSAAWGRASGTNATPPGDAASSPQGRGVVPAGPGIVSAGTAARESAAAPILMLDARVLPGMEGGPVLDARGDLVGVLAPPLAARFPTTASPGAPAFDADGAHVAPLALSARCLRDALRDARGADIFADIVARGEAGPRASAAERRIASPASVAAAASRAVVLVETDDGDAWASGVFLRVADEARGERAHFIVTNAHAVQPSAAAAGGDGRGPTTRSVRAWVPTFSAREAREVEVEVGTAKREEVSATGPGADSGGATDRPFRFERRDAEIVRVSTVAHLDLAVLAVPARPGDAAAEPRWADDASEGDGAGFGRGLKRERVGGDVEFPVGAPALVVAHARVGPRAFASMATGGMPHVTAGTVSSAARRFADDPGSVAMLTTDAAVTAGASGGALVAAEDGRLLGLVTSNARRGGGAGGGGGGAGGAPGASGASNTSGSGSGSSRPRILPRLSFAAPAAALEPLRRGAAAAAAAAAGEAPGSAAAATARRRAFEAVDGLDARDARAAAIWGLRDPDEAEWGAGEGGEGDARRLRSRM